MSIVTFLNDDREQTGKTLTSVAVATRMAIERNLKILLISTSYKDETMKNCYWRDVAVQKKILGMKNTGIGVNNGIEGLAKLVMSNKIQPSIITDYTRVIFKGRLEVLNGYIGTSEKTEEQNRYDYEKTSECYGNLVRLANQFYDIVIVDLDNDLNETIKKDILQSSNLNIFVTTQRLSSLDKYNKLKNINKEMIGPKYIPVIAKYDKNSKYNKKNIMRYLDEKKDINLIPYNVLFFEAAEEADVAELFLKLRNIKDTNDDNYIFMEEVLKLVDLIIKRLQELQKKMR